MFILYKIIKKEVVGVDNLIAFVILHYNNIIDTKDCISSIKKNANEAKILVVSNSQDLENLSTLEDSIDELIVNKKNIGFAKANNLGCLRAITLWNPDFLCVINNDILITQQNFCQSIYDCYNLNKFDVLGPKIITDNGDSVNPFPAYRTILEIEKAIKNAKMWNHIYGSFILRNMYAIYKTIKPRKKTVLQNGQHLEKNVSLHGCALIFSKKYYTKYKDVFYPDTFLYHEEEFLEYRRCKDNLLFIYDPSIEVFHKEGVSLNKSIKKEKERIIFRNNEIIKSLTKLLELKQMEEKR